MLLFALSYFVPTFRHTTYGMSNNYISKSLLTVRL